MPSKKKKYNTRFPASRIKKIMQTDEEIGKVAQAVPIIISRTLELFVESLLRQSMQITQSRNAKTLTPSHMKQCILAESRFDFLKDLVKSVPDASVQEDNENNALENAEALDYSIGKEEVKSIPELPAVNYFTEQLPSKSNPISSRTPVIQLNPKYTEVTSMANDNTDQTCPKTHPLTHDSQHDTLKTPKPTTNFSIDHLVSSGCTSINKTVSSGTNTQQQQPITPGEAPHLHLDFSHLSAAALATEAGTAMPSPPVHDKSDSKCPRHGLTAAAAASAAAAGPTKQLTNHIIAASPSSSSSYTKVDEDSGISIATNHSISSTKPPQPNAIPPQNTGDNLYIDEDYDN